MKRFCSLLIAIILLILLATPCLAAENNETVVSPRYTYISFNDVGLTIDEATGKAACFADCYTTNYYTVTVECSLQIFTSNTWYNLRTWTATGTRYAVVDKSWVVSSGYTYRVHAIFRVYDTQGNLLEEAIGNAGYVYPKQ